MADKLAYLKRHKWMYFLMLPGIIYFIIFKYVPMGGLIIAFQNYSPYLGIAGSDVPVFIVSGRSSLYSPFITDANN